MSTDAHAGAGAVDERDLEGLQAAFERRAPGGRLVVHLNPLQQSSGREHAPTAGQRGAAADGAPRTSSSPTPDSDQISPSSSVDSLYLY